MAIACYVACMQARQAAAFAAVERAGLTKSDIARIAGVHRSQVSRWVSGDQRPSYDRTMRLAARLRREHPELADELVAAAGYGPAGPDSEPNIPPDVLKVIRKNYDPEQQQQIIDMLSEFSERDELAEGAAPSRPGAGGTSRAG